MPFFSPKYTNCKRFSDHFCFFGAAPALRLGRAMSQLAIRSALRFFRYAQKNWVWPSATAFYPSAAHLIFSGHYFFFGGFGFIFLDQWVKTVSFTFPFPLSTEKVEGLIKNRGYSKFCAALFCCLGTSP